MFIVIYFVLMAADDVLLEDRDHAFTIYTEGCVIPNFPLIGESIANLVGRPQKTINCTKSLNLLNSNESHIWVEPEAFPYFSPGSGREFFCTYTSFSPNKFIENILYGNSIEFAAIITVQHEFVRVECYYIENKIHDEFFVYPKMRKPVKVSNTNSTKFNILMVGLESVSRLNFLRTMPETANFLRDRDSVQLLGYNKLGDNSFPNLFPLLMGRSFKQALRDCIHKNISVDMINNTCTYIWDMFKSEGYVTALGSDSPAGLLSTYEYSIHKLPTDYYLQPFMYETRQLFNNKYYYYHMCAGNKFYYNILLNYIYDLTECLRHNNFFGIFWEESISHEHLNYPHIMDTDYTDLLLKLEDNGYLDESVLIFFSDHGMRWGDIVLTEQGRLEERLPLLEVLFPKKFKDLYKLAYENFKENANRLTTPYDVYETLKDLLDPTLLHERNIVRRSSEETNVNKSSLFIPISDRRTCALLGISEHFCTCYNGEMTKANIRNRELAADHLITHINSLLRKFPQCQKLAIKDILEVSMKRDSHGSTFKVMIKTSPGGGIFDGTLRRERQIWVVSGTVSRLNLYRGQSSCVRHDQIEMYCYCKRQPSP